MKKTKKIILPLPRDFNPKDTFLVDLIAEMTSIVREKIIAIYLEKGANSMLISPLNLVTIFVVHLVTDTLRCSMIQNTTIEMRRAAIEEVVGVLSESMITSWQALEAYSVPKDNMQ